MELLLRDCRTALPKGTYSTNRTAWSYCCETAVQLYPKGHIVQTGLRGVTVARLPYGFTKVSRFKFHATKSVMSIKPES